MVGLKHIANNGSFILVLALLQFGQWTMGMRYQTHLLLRTESIVVCHGLAFQLLSYEKEGAGVKVSLSLCRRIISNYCTC